MTYISIGNACNIKYQIDKYKGKRETLFFDWLTTDMNTIIEILKCDNIDKILNINNLLIDSEICIDQKYVKCIIKSLSQFVSYHDIIKNYNNNDINNFIDKYKRRFNRIIEYIKSRELLYFIRFNNITENEKNLFFETIYKINPNCNFYLIIINNTKNIENIFKDKNYIEISPKILSNIKRDWTTSHINWKQIFIDIENYTKDNKSINNVNNVKKSGSIITTNKKMLYYINRNKI